MTDRDDHPPLPQPSHGRHIRAKVRIGVSGWRYKRWRADFYPPGLPQRLELEYLSRRLTTLEVNGTFYSLQRPESFLAWYDQTPAGFRFAIKGSRFITHNKKLGDVDAALANFFAQGVLALREKLGPILWQLPANFPARPDRVRAFLRMLPKTADAALRRARRHDERVARRSWLREGGKRRIRHALEIRSSRLATPEVVRACLDRGIALAFTHSGKDWPYFEELTAGFVYLRLHGAPDTYASRYGDDALDRWQEKISRWQRGSEPPNSARITDRKPPVRKGRDVYVYFDNDARGHAPRDALRLAQRLGLVEDKP